MRILLLLLFVAGVFAQSQQCLDKEFVQELQNSLQLNAQSQVIMNAMKQNQFPKIARNEEILRHHNKYFTHEIPTGRVTDQKSTGRCWLYAMLNTIRPAVVKKTQMKDFEFSQCYLYFWDKMEKANFFLEKAIARSKLDLRSREFRQILGNPIEEGGYWQTATNLIKKYGCVPRQAMPEVASTTNSRQLRKVLNYQARYFAYCLKQLREQGKTLKELREQKKKYLKIFYRILVIHLGRPVEKFQFRYFILDKNKKKILTPYQSYTPQSFAKKFVKENLDDFVMFANWPGRDYNRHYAWQNSNNVVEGEALNFVNLPMSKIKKMMQASILGDDPVNFSADVGKQSDRMLGIMADHFYLYEQTYGVPFNFDKKINTMITNINSTHAMVVLGLDMFKNKVIKWKVENSWGTDNGDKGMFYMYDSWVDRYVVRVVINKKYISKKILAIAAMKPTVIPEDQPEQ